MLRKGESGDWIGTFVGHKGAVWSCVLDPTAFLAATGSADFTARIWDAVTGEEKHTITHPHIVRSVHFSNSSRTLATGGADKKIRLHDLTQLPPSSEEFATAGGSLFALAFSRDDKYLYSTYNDKPGISVWDVRTKELVKTLPTDTHSASIEVSRDADLLVTAYGKTVAFWDPTTLEVIKQVQIEKPVECASYSHAKQKFVAGGEDMSVRLFDYKTGELLDSVKGHHGPVHTIMFSPDGRHYASGSEDGTIRIWDTDFYLTGPGSPDKTPNGTVSESASEQ